MASKGNTARHIRVSDKLWEATIEQAEADGMAPSEVVRALLRAYTRGEIAV